MKIPYVALDRAFNRYRDFYMDLTDHVLSAGLVYDGLEIAELENKIARLCNRKHAVAVASCSDALYFALLANGIGAGDEVIVPAYSFISSASCILRAGATPVFADVDRDMYMVTQYDIRKCITNKTKAIIAVNLFGSAVLRDDIELEARNHSLILIEDAAQSFGAYYGNDGDEPVGSMGNTSCISFDPMKNLCSFGSGGMCVTDDLSIAKKIMAFRNHGKIDNQIDVLGIKSKMSTVDAATVLLKLSNFRNENERRKTIAQIYINGLLDIDEITLPIYSYDIDQIWHKFVMVVKNKEHLCNYLDERGIQTRDIYPRVLYNEPLFNEYKRDSCLHAESITKGNIALPIYPDLRDDEVTYIVETISDFYS